MDTQRVIYYKLHPSAIEPQYANDTDSGADVFSIKSVTIMPGKSEAISTGIQVELPYGYELQVRSKSGIAAKKNVFVLNSPGTIDTDYRDEIKVLLFNLSDTPYQVETGQKVAQLVLCPVSHADYKQLTRNGGFGSTGLSAEPVPTIEQVKDNVIPITSSTQKGKGYWVSTDNDDTGFLNGTLGIE